MKKDLKALIKQFLDETREDRQYIWCDMTREREPTFSEFIEWIMK